MRVVFFGIYDIGVNSLVALLRRRINVVAVVTKPNTASEVQPVALLAVARDLPLLQPSSPKEASFITRISELQPELIAVAGYHAIIPKKVLDLPSRGAINLHGSLLPKYRGPSTWKWSIVNGEPYTGVTVHVMTPELDNGDILEQQTISIEDDDTGESLFRKISVVGAELLGDTIEKIQTGQGVRFPQDENQASYWGYPTEEDTRIDWDCDAIQIRNKIRGFAPRPGAWTRFGDRQIRILQSSLTASPSVCPPGTVVGIRDISLVIATATYDIEIQNLVLDNHGPVNASQLVHNLKIAEDSQGIAEPGDKK